MQVQMHLNLQARLLVLARSHPREHHVARRGNGGRLGGRRCLGDGGIVTSLALAVARRPEIGHGSRRTRSWGRSVSRRRLVMLVMLVMLFLLLLLVSFGLGFRHERKGIEDSGKQPSEKWNSYVWEDKEMEEMG